MPLVDPSASVVRCARIVIVFAATIFEGYLTKTGPQARWKGVAGPMVRFKVWFWFFDALKVPHASIW